MVSQTKFKVNGVPTGRSKKRGGTEHETPGVFVGEVTQECKGKLGGIFRLRRAPVP